MLANTIGALGATAPARAQVVPDVGAGINVVDPVWLVCVPVPVPKFWTDVWPNAIPHIISIAATQKRPRTRRSEPGMFGRGVKKADCRRDLLFTKLSSRRVQEKTRQRRKLSGTS